MESSGLREFFSTFALLDDLLIFHHRWISKLYFSLPDTVQQQYLQHSDQQSGRLPSGGKRSMDHQGTMFSVNSRLLLQILHNIHNLPYGSTFLLWATRRFFWRHGVGNERFSNMAWEMSFSIIFEWRCNIPFGRSKNSNKSHTFFQDFQPWKGRLGAAMQNGSTKNLERF